MVTIRRLLLTEELLIALALLAAVVLLSPPTGSTLTVTIVIFAAVLSTGGALCAIRGASVRGTRLARLGSWARATAALGASASILMILDASVAAIR